MRTVETPELPLFIVPLPVHPEVGAGHRLLAQLLLANLLLHFSDHLCLVLSHAHYQVLQVLYGALKLVLVRKRLGCLAPRTLENQSFAAVDV